ncbi:reverse transcriptase domain-containing protein [Tanacetum coccineum]|uniref:Reverse transcriptase domain-containing protein n=1 Tax=Tanacetum coccineum TaxID=301880 RepID=A0ABQ5B0H4_9ASTR
MPTEMELTLEQTQQGVSYKVSVFTMKMEILLEPTSNKLMVDTYAIYEQALTTETTMVDPPRFEDTFYNGLNDNDQDSLNAAAGGNLLSKTTREALNIIENKSKVRYSRNKPNASRINSTSKENASKTDERIDKLVDQLSTLVEIVSKKVVTPAPIKVVEETCVTCGGAHSWYNCPTTDNNQASVCATTGFQNQPFQVPNNQVQQEFSNNFSSYKRNNDQMMRNMQNQINSLKGDLKNEIQNTIKSQQAVMMNQQTTFQNNLQNMICGLFQNQASTSGTLPSNTIPNPKGEMKAITTRSGVAYEGPSIPTNPSPKKVVERETKETTDKEQSNFQGSTAQIPPPVIPISIPEPDVPKTLPKTTPIPEPDVPKNLPKPNIPYPSRLNQEKFREKASYQKEKIFQMFQDLRFDISFADALFFMPRFAPTIRNLLMNKEKLLELAKIPLNENCSAMLLKKLPEKLGDPDKFLIPCNFSGMDIFWLAIPSRQLLNNDSFQLPLMDLKQSEVTKVKSSIEEPLELELKDLPSHLEYAYLEENDKLPVIIAKGLKDVEKEALLKVLKSHKRAIAWKITDIKAHCIPVSKFPRKVGITVVANEENELILTRLVPGESFDNNRKLNEATRKDHFSLPFMDQMLERLAGNEFYCFLDGFLGYFQIPIDPQDQEKTTFTCPYGTLAYRRMPFGLCNAPGTFQRCMMAIFHDMIEKTMEVFMDNF